MFSSTATQDANNRHLPLCSSHHLHDCPATERDSQGRLPQLPSTREGVWGLHTRPGSRRITLLPGRLWRGAAEPHSVSVLAQGNGFFLLIALHENPQNPGAQHERHGVTCVVSMSQGKHRTGKSLGKGQCRRACVHAHLHRELSTHLPRAARVTNERCGHHGAGAPSRYLTQEPAQTLPCRGDIAHSCPFWRGSWQGPCLSLGTGSAWAWPFTGHAGGSRCCSVALVPSRPLLPAACSRVPPTPWAGVGRQGRGLWLWGMQDEAG